MKGWIFGLANQKTWTQKIYKHTNKFQNPLHQNYKHVKTLEAQLIFRLPPFTRWWCLSVTPRSRLRCPIT